MKGRIQNNFTPDPLHKPHPNYGLAGISSLRFTEVREISWEARREGKMRVGRSMGIKLSRFLKK